MEHQVEQLRGGMAPDDLIDPRTLAPLTRTSLKEAFRGVARVQRGIRLKLGMEAGVDLELAHPLDRGGGVEFSEKVHQLVPDPSA